MLKFRKRKRSRLIKQTIQNIKDNGMQAGVSLNPHTPVHLLKDIIADLDQALAKI